LWGVFFIYAIGLQNTGIPKMISAADEARISELETQVTFLEDSVSALDGALIGQQLRIEELELLIRDMRQRLESQALKVEVLKEDDAPPPHY
tara:strand:+ start:129 stop:404 length:276 start_codon:yes stop_codon:yes gene_type:complete